MKKIFLLLLSVSVFVSCQKKEYPTFNYSSAAVSSSQKQVKTTALAEVATVADAARPAVAAPQQLSASANEEIAVVTEQEAALAAIPAEAITTKAAPAEAKATAAKPAKLTWTQRMVAKKIEKQIKKANAPEAVKATKAQDTVALLSLIFGGAGLLLLFVGGGFGLLLGIAGLVLGIIGLGRVKKGEAPASSKTMALLGTIFGGVVALLGLIVVAAVSSSGFYL